MSHSISDSEFKDFINGSEVIPGDGRVKLAVEDVIKSRLSPDILSRAQVSIFKGDNDKLKKRVGFASFNWTLLLRRPIK